MANTVTKQYYDTLCCYSLLWIVFVQLCRPAYSSFVEGPIISARNLKVMGSGGISIHVSFVTSLRKSLMHFNFQLEWSICTVLFHVFLF